MPALQPVHGVAKVVVSATANGVNIVNVFHVQNGFSSSQVYSVAGIQALATTFAGAFQTNFLPVLATSWTAGVVTATDLSSETGFQATAAISGGGSGGGALTTPQQACACITWKIGRQYRGGHPRTYIGPLYAGAILNSTSLAAAYITLLQTNAGTFRNTINGSSADGVIQSLVAVHRKRNKVDLVPPLVSFINSAFVDTRIDTQRRRLGRDR